LLHGTAGTRSGRRLDLERNEARSDADAALAPLRPPGCLPRHSAGSRDDDPRAYDPIADPAELHDLLTAEPDTVSTLEASLIGSSRQRNAVEKPKTVPDSFAQARERRGYWTNDE
jgi:hypothetical protein